LLAAFTTLMVAFVAASSYKVAEYATVTKDTINGLFVTSASGTRPTGAPKIVEGEDPWAATPRVNILLLGSDAGKDRTGTRTDSMMVASVDTKTGRTVLISLPRNLERAPIPVDNPLHQQYPNGFGVPSCDWGPHSCLLAYVWRKAEEHKAAHPEAWHGEEHPGPATIRGVIQEIVGLKIDQTVIIDLKGFVQLINAMGGIDVNVKLTAYGTKVPIGGEVKNGRVVGITGYFEPGLQHLDGQYALWYARSRNGDDDYGRMQRQRCVVRAVIDQVNPAGMLAKYPELARIAKDNIYTDIAGDDLGAYVELIERIQGAQISSVAITPKNGINSSHPDFRLIRSLVQKAIMPPPATPTSTATSTSTKTPTPTSTKTPKPTTTTQQDTDGCE
jgi:LCP family protein required for cell wall assembly